MKWELRLRIRSAKYCSGRIQQTLKNCPCVIWRQRALRWLSCSLLWRTTENSSLSKLKRLWSTISRISITCANFWNQTSQLRACAYLGIASCLSRLSKSWIWSKEERQLSSSISAITTWRRIRDIRPWSSSSWILCGALYFARRFSTWT